MRKPAGFEFEPLRRPRESHARRENRRDLAEYLTERMARHRDEQVTRARQSCVQIRLNCQGVRKLSPGEVTLVAAVMRHDAQLLAIAAPQPGRPAAACELDRQGG